MGMSYEHNEQWIPLVYTKQQLCHTMNYLPLLMDDAMAKAAVAFEAAHSSFLVPDEIIFKQGTRLDCCVLNF